MTLEVEGCGGLLRSRYGFGREFGQAEVEDFGVAAIRDKEVRGLNVAMNDAFGVRGIQGVGDLDAQREQSFQFHGTAGNAVLQGCAFQKLHGNERLPFLFPDVVDGADVGMIQGGRSLCFSLESGESMRITGYILRQKLERDETVETSVLRFVNHSHPAAAELLDDAVMRDGLADHAEKPLLARHVRLRVEPSQRRVLDEVCLRTHSG